jgi:hypothetical protein
MSGSDDILSVQSVCTGATSHQLGIVLVALFRYPNSP